MKKTLYALLLFVLALAAYPASASAHVKWFVDSEKVLAESQGSVPFYGVTSAEVLIWSVVTLIAVLAFGVLDAYVRTPKKLLAFGHRHEKGITRIAQAVLGLFLVSVSLLWNVVLIPEFQAIGGFASGLKILQIGIGLALIFNIAPRIAAGLLFAMTLMLGWTHGLVALAENAMLLSLAAFFFIKNSPSDSWWNSCDKHAVEIVRIGTAVSLIVLAFTEKLMYPELSMSFLSIHQWNFMAGIFPWFTDKLFVLSTGFAELIFGIVFLLGYMTRVNTILIAGFFAASVVTMATQFRAWEVEDLVVYSAAILFVFYGHGKTKFFHAWWPGSWLHKRIAGPRG